MATWWRRLPAAGTAPCLMATGLPPAWLTFRAPTICTGISRSRPAQAATDPEGAFPVMSKSFLAVVFAAIVTPAFSADYQTNLGPMPLDDETKLVIGGRGEATASSDGKTMTVKGSFHDLLSNA